MIPAVDHVFADEADKETAIPIWIARDGEQVDKLPGLQEKQAAWLKQNNFSANAGSHCVLPGDEGALGGVVLGAGGSVNKPAEKLETLFGALPHKLPPKNFVLAQEFEDADLAAISWGLGAYRFGRYKSSDAKPMPKLRICDSANRDRVLNIVQSVWFGRDLINTPASDLGPDELEAGARCLADLHRAQMSSIVGDDLLAHNLPMIHAVGRASPRLPRLIDLMWQHPDTDEKTPKVTLVGKGICFDTGGLDLKPPAGMLLMKKDMGGAASVLALGHMIMGHRLKVRLRILIPAAENSVSGNAFRPSDVLPSRAGKTVEVGNTDAEGRLVLADALRLADEDAPDTLISMATLTGAARVALGPDLPALFSTDDKLADTLADVGSKISDPVWRLPFWANYASLLKSEVADIKNVSDGPFAGAITAALFLQAFVDQAKRYAHVDMYGWRPVVNPLGPKGGEPNAARALFLALQQELEP